MLEITEPIFSWCPQQLPPDIQAISYQLRKRWKMALTPTRIYRPSAKTLGIFGYKPRVLSAVQVTHDLHVTEIYLLLKKRSPERAARWKGEAEIASESRGGKCPDALIVGSPSIEIEFGGSYPPHRVAKVHAACAEKSAAYEIW
jgi:hypothetical protein